MKLIISFSARENGNCDSIADSVSTPGDKVLYLRNQNIHPCANCSYECFQGKCKYRDDDAYRIYAQMQSFDKVILIVPMYCGNPCSLYFTFLERSQDYFMSNDHFMGIVSRLYLIGIYGSAKDAPDFIPCLAQWFQDSPYQNRVLGIQRHLYGQKIGDSVLDVEAVRSQIQTFLDN